MTALKTALRTRHWLAFATLMALFQASTVRAQQPSQAPVAPRPASAPTAQPTSDPIPVHVTIVLAKEAPGTIDPQLQTEPAWRNPPFNQYRSLAVLGIVKGALSSQGPFLLDLPNGRKLSIALSARLPDGRHRVSVSINRPGQTDYLPLMSVVAAPGEPFFVAGQRHLDGILLLRVRIGKRPPRGAWLLPPQLLRHRHGRPIPPGPPEQRLIPRSPAQPMPLRKSVTIGT